MQASATQIRWQPHNCENFPSGLTQQRKWAPRNKMCTFVVVIRMLKFVVTAKASALWLNFLWGCLFFFCCDEQCNRWLSALADTGKSSKNKRLINSRLQLGHLHWCVSQRIDESTPLHQSAYTGLHNYSLLVAAGPTNATTLQGQMAGHNSPGSCSN